MERAEGTRFGAKHLIVGAAILYLAAYVSFRVVNTEVWEEDDRAYVIFPSNPVAIYYLFRPLTYLDGALTGMRFHIGPHQ